MQLKYNQEEFQQLIASSSAYMSKIEAYSIALSDYTFEHQLFCLQHCLKILEDQSIPIIKKLFVFRFIKDTLILASLSFYECVIIKIFPWLSRFSVCFKSVVEESRVAEAGKMLRGSKSLPVAEISVCKNLISLIQDILKWMGTHIQNHPYSPIEFKSAFRLLLEKYPQVSAKKLNQLTFFKPEDVNRYQAYYLEKETSDSEGERLSEYIKHEVDLVERVGHSDTLLLLLQTGDEFVISCLIEEMQTRFEQIDKQKAEMGLQMLQAINELFLLGEVHFCNEVKQELLCPILIFALMLQELQVKGKQQSGVSRVICYLRKWQEKCVQLKMPCQSIKLVIKRLTQQRVQTIKKYQIQANPRLVLNLITDINKDKVPYIDFNETQLLLKLSNCQYIPLQSSDHVIEKQNVSKNSMDEPSHSSIKSYNKKSNFLEAYSKVPPSNPLTPKNNNTSEVKQIYFQHSNLSQRFHQFQQSTPEESNANHLLMSFKVSNPHFADNSRSPQVIFSDSFTSNQKNPTKQSKDSFTSNQKNQTKQSKDSFTSNQKNPTKQSKKHEENIYIIYEPSNTIQNSSISKPSQKGQIMSQKHVFNSSYDREVHDLKQQSNKRNTSKMSEVSNYYKEEIKQSADFAQRQLIQIKRNHINDYMLPSQYSQVDSVRRSKHSDQKQQNPLYEAKSTEKKLRKSRTKKEGSLSSRGDKSKSIKVIYFNQTEKQGHQGYQLRTAHQRKIQVEVIRVEKTVLKPKFGFSCQEQQTINTETVEEESIAKELNFTIKEESISFYPSISGDNLPNLEQIPQNFKDVLARNKEKIKVNQFNHKARELQIKIEKMKERKQKIQKVVKLKSVQIQKIKQQLPVPLNVLQNQNKSLLKALKINKQKSCEIIHERTDLKCPILHISGAPLREEFKKQILYLKCKLFHDKFVEIGMQVKNKELALYFTFFKSVDQCAIKVEENSLKLSQRIDAKMYKVLQGKQIKFKSKIQNYILFDYCFEMAKLRLDIKIAKNSKTQIIPLPYHLYNQLQFKSPTHHFNTNKSTDWHFSCPSLRENHQYLQDFLPKGKFSEGKYRVGIELKDECFDYQIVVEGQKFAVKYEDRLQKQQFPILNTLISLFQVGRVVN